MRTTDNTAFEIKVFFSNDPNNQGANGVMRIEPTAISPNIIAGYQGNSLASGLVGTTIAGGGGNDGINTVGSAYGTVSNGRYNNQRNFCAPSAVAIATASAVPSGTSWVAAETR